MGRPIRLPDSLADTRRALAIAHALDLPLWQLLRSAHELAASGGESA